MPRLIFQQKQAQLKLYSK